MDKSTLADLIRSRGSYLCVGLDPDLSRMPAHLRSPHGVIDFCRAIIESTREYAVAYKPNIAFFEGLGKPGWSVLHEVAKFLPVESFKIADAKRADIGNTSRMYAKAFFEEMNFDAITVAPYMGSDSVAPFLDYEDKWTILLALTSNEGYQDFQLLESGGARLYEHVIKVSQSWGTPDNLMYVVGATHPEMLSEVRRAAPEHFFLVPGVGAQGGDLGEVSRSAMNDDFGILVNSTRSIIYASSGQDFAERAGEEARKLREQMASFIRNK